MQIIKSISEFNKARNTLIGSIGFIPTMGALHEGHLSLIKTAKSSCQNTIASIFVNPKQFAPNEDFNSYPRMLDQDINKLRSLNIDILFIPSEDEIYNKNSPDIIYDNYMFDILEGKSRPGFFNGICIVVAKLFDIVKPTDAFFGEKDFQQLRIIEKMSSDLNYNINIIPCKIIREINGLAMSSRNKHLSSSEAEKSKIIFNTLELGFTMIKNDTKVVEDIYDILNKKLKQDSVIKLDYLKVVDYNSLIEFSDFVSDNFAICVAGYINQVRLIDNITYLYSEDSSI